MKYFKNSEVARLYNISEKTVRNWVIASKENKMSLEVYADNKGKYYVADTTKNAILIQSLVEDGKKYRNSRTHKIIAVSNEFYTTYSKEQMVDIVGYLEKHQEMPFQYSHMSKGVDFSSRYYERIWNENRMNSQVLATRLLSESSNYIKSCIASEQFNIVEIGGRNGFIARELIKDFGNKGILATYTDIDISKDMLVEANDNIQTWFKDPPVFKTFARDINKSQFDDILFDNLCTTKRPSLVLFLGSTLFNLISPQRALQNIGNSMSQSDVFAVSMKLDSKVSRRYFDFNSQFENTLLPPNEKYQLDILGIEESLYEVEQFYDKTDRCRKVQTRLKFDLTLVFTFGDYEKRIDFSKGDAILLWRYWHYSLEEIEVQMRQAGFTIMQSTKSPDEQFAMVIAKVKQHKQ